LHGGQLSVRDITILGCSSQQPTRKRNHGAYLIRWNEEGLLFDPGEGTQRQFIFANIAPTVVSRIFVSHFHGDHCLGLGSMLMRLNLDKVPHTIHCYYPGSCKKNFDALRFGCIYHEVINVVEHPVFKKGLVEDDGKFKIEAVFLEHGVDDVGWRLTEPDRIKFDKQLLKKHNIIGPDVSRLQEKGSLKVGDKTISLDDVSHVKKGDSIAVVIDTAYCDQAIEIAKGAKVLICESTYLEQDKNLAKKYLHMTASQAATLAKKAGVEMLILTHFSARYTDLDCFAREAGKIFPNVHVAQDLLTIPIPR
jgi:ribonuclease Z